MKAKKNENLIHVKFEYEEALEARKEILSAQMRLVRLLKVIKKYKFLRLNELELKRRLKVKLSEEVKNIKTLQNELPPLKATEMPKMEKDEESELEKQVESVKIKRYETDLESQIQEIQDRLNSLKA